jgi:LDH2 family malate/lactate/ureidoglycolate dehydrogenase
MGYTIFSSERLNDFFVSFFASYGFSPADAALISGVLLRADLCGIESHGFARITRYDEEIASGQVDVSAMPVAERETPVSAVVDGCKAMGQLTSIFAMNKAIEKAKTAGIGVVSVRNSNHFGIAGYYTNMAVEEGLLGICMTNSEAICVPTNGKKAMLGTNALALAMPARPVPFSFDASTSVVPRGKLDMYKLKGEPLPADWALDTEGRPTRDAAAVVDAIIRKAGGGIAPLGGSGEGGGGWKGYGLAAIVEIFSAVFSGGLTSNHVNVKPGEAGMCHFFAAVDYELFGSKAAIEGALSAFLQELRDSPTAEGQARIWTHGERAAQTLAARQKEGIPINDLSLAAVNKIAEKRGVPPVSHKGAPKT